MTKHMRERPSFRWPHGLAEWMQAFAFFVLTIGIILGPFYLVREIQDETKTIVARLEASSEQATNRSIRVNIFTLACLQDIDPEDESEARFEVQLARCIREGLIEADDLNLSTEELLTAVDVAVAFEPSQHEWLEGMSVAIPLGYSPLNTCLP